jgi:predicted AlkP superfamily pyrophosphatase or phosphodiesterase
VIPDYGGRSIADVVPAIAGRTALLPDAARTADQIVLLVLDGVGWNQLQDRRAIAPTLASMEGGPITSVAPTTTATALSSIVSGTPPAGHGVIGYRVRVAEDRVLNILRWRTADGDARRSVPAADFAVQPAFPGFAAPVPVVSKAEFAATGFTVAMGITRMVGWHAPSAIALEVGRLLDEGEPLVYAYYDGVDKVAHAKGFGPHYDAELAATDRLVADLVAVLPAGAALLVTSDHGQVDVGDRTIAFEDDVLDDVALFSGEGRFVWLHAKDGRVDALLERCRARYGDVAAVHARDELIDAGWFGGPLRAEVAARLGDVALVATTDVAFLDPTDTGSHALRCRHGALSDAELLVPLLASWGSTDGPRSRRP